MTDWYASLDEKPYDSHYLYEEIDIDRPVAEVWPFALDIGGWMDAHVLETVAGTAGQVGHFERVLPRKTGDDVPLPHHHVYGIAHLVPHKYIALEVLPEKGGSYGNTRPWMSFDGIFLVDLGGSRTKVIFLLVDAHLSKGSKESYEQRAKQLEAVRQDILVGYLEKLKRQCEAGQ